MTDQIVFPFPAEGAHRRLDAIIEHSPRQAEALLIIISLVHNMKPGYALSRALIEPVGALADDTC